MSAKQPFRPNGAATKNITVGAASARVELSSGEQQRVMNNGTATVWIEFGGASVDAVAATSIPVGPGVTEVFTPEVGSTYVAAIAAAATGIIYFTPGSGF